MKELIKYFNPGGESAKPGMTGIKKIYQGGN